MVNVLLFVPTSSSQIPRVAKSSSVLLRSIFSFFGKSIFPVWAAFLWKETTLRLGSMFLIFCTAELESEDTKMVAFFNFETIEQLPKDGILLFNKNWWVSLKSEIVLPIRIWKPIHFPSPIAFLLAPTFSKNCLLNTKWFLHYIG